MQEHAAAVEALKQDLRDAPAFPAQHLLREDVAAIETRLRSGG